MTDLEVIGPVAHGPSVELPRRGMQRGCRLLRPCFGCAPQTMCLCGQNAAAPASAAATSVDVQKLGNSAYTLAAYACYLWCPTCCCTPIYQEGKVPAPPLPAVGSTSSSSAKRLRGTGSARCTVTGPCQVATVLAAVKAAAFGAPSCVLAPVRAPTSAFVSLRTSGPRLLVPHTQPKDPLPPSSIQVQVLSSVHALIGSLSLALLLCRKTNKHMAGSTRDRRAHFRCCWHGPTTLGGASM